MSNENQHFYEFKNFRLDLGERQLFREGVPVALMPKAFDVLSALVERNGHLVEKDELLHLVWNDAFVEEASVSRIVYTLRKVLGEDENDNKYIETVAKHGYRFVAEVRKIKTQSIAVLPLKPVNTDNRDLIFELGIAESIILKLNATKGVTVRPLSAIRKYSDIEQDALTAGREQKVEYVLESNYQLANGKIRVTSQLFNVQTGAIEETLQSEKDSTDIFSMQGAIANDFGNTLLARFGKALNNQTAKRYTTSEKAYRLYLDGMNLTDKRNRDDSRKAAELFEQAIKLDPNYALAYVGLAYAHSTISFWGGDPREEYPISKNAVEKALQLDENLAEAFTILGEIQDYYEWDFPAAEKSHRHAIELNPNSSFAHRFYAYHLIAVTHLDEANAEIKTAIDLDPNSMWNQGILGMVLHFARRYDEAITQFKRVVEMDRNDISRVWLSNSLELKGDYYQAFEWFLQAETQRGASAGDLDSWKTIYAKSGWQEVLRRQLERNKQEEKNGGYPYWEIANFSAQLGDKDMTFVYLEKSYQIRDPYIVWLRIEPHFDSLRSDPRYLDLVRRIGFPQ